jgi:hypothetical protein
MLADAEALVDAEALADVDVVGDALAEAPPDVLAAGDDVPLVPGVPQAASTNVNTLSKTISVRFI